MPRVRRKCSSRTAARSRSASSARCASWASAASPSTRRADRAARHVAFADEAYAIGRRDAGRELPQRRRGSSRRLGSAGAEAVHPGYGFLAENAGFARACADAGLVWIGPPPEAIEAMGSKIAARERMRAAGVPIVPGTTEPLESATAARRLGDELGWPLAIKASAGGGGKGLKVVRTPDEAERGVRVGAARGRGVLLRRDRLHRALPRGSAPRRGAGPRRRARERHPPGRARLHDPAPPPEARRGDALAGGRRRAARADRRGSRVDAARAVGYRSAGTIEGLLSRDGEYFFLEMNTRIQVEHTVTEMVTGTRPRPRAGSHRGRGAAIGCARRTSGCRARDRVPDQRRGPVHRLPARARADRALPRAVRARGFASTRASTDGSEISPLYDPMVAKLIVHGQDREHARARMLRALDEFEIGGVTTLLGFHRALLAHPCFVDGATCHGVVESEELAERAEQLSHETTVAAASDGTTRRRAHDARGRARRPALRGRAARARAAVGRARPRARASAAAAAARRRRTARDAVVSPMQGTVLAVEVAEGDAVTAGPGALRRRGDEDGERGARPPRRRRPRALRRGRRSRSRPAR